LAVLGKELIVGPGWLNQSIAQADQTSTVAIHISLNPILLPKANRPMDGTGHLEEQVG
jgi:hypothetical protein